MVDGILREIGHAGGPARNPMTAATRANPVTDHGIEHPRGRLFARQWHPAEAVDTLPPIVMFHDSLGCVDLWRGFPAALCEATSRRVVAYDRLGFGRSDARHDRLSRDFVAEESSLFLPALREQLQVDRFVALGHSVGGGMAIEAAARYPADCEALVTIAAQVFVEQRTLDGIRAARDGFAEPGQLEKLAKYHGDKAPWVLDAWVGTWLDPAFAGWTLRDVLPGVTCPVLALHGELDEYGSSAHPTSIGELSAGIATVEVLAGLGHVPHREDQAMTVELVRNFLARSAGAA
jgi:pimeloyl-ACP methyl ester carboxylesterase